MNALIDVFRMTEIDGDVRCRILIKLGQAIDNQLGGNYTHELVFELVSALRPQHPILDTLRKTFPKSFEGR